MAVVEPAVWFPTIRAGTGADVFTERLCAGIESRGLRAKISWLPHRAEYLPWTVGLPQVPRWANIVHVNTWLHRRFLPAGIPVVATMHHVVHDPGFARFKRPVQSLYHRLWVKPIEQRVLDCAARITCVSGYTANQLLRCFGISETTVIHNGVDLSLFRPPETRRTHVPFRLLYVGSWSSRKGTDMLAPIMARLGPDFELRYNGPERPMPTNCHAVGRLDDTALAAAYRESDALLFPSRLEGFGQVVAEAMACGLPVIAGRNSALPEVVKHGQTGLLVGEADPDAFADAARMIRAEQDLRGRMSTEARHSAQRNFDIELMIDAYVRLYRDLTRQGQAHGE